MSMRYCYQVRLPPMIGPLIKIQSVPVLTDEIYSHILERHEFPCGGITDWNL